MNLRALANKRMHPLVVFAALGAVITAVLLAPSGAARVTSVQAASPGGHIGGTNQPTCTLDASGYCTVTHGLGYQPAGVVMMSDRIGQLGSTDQFTATTFRARWWWHTGGLFAAGTKIAFSWVPGGGVAPTPTPTVTTTPPTTSTPPTSPPVTTPPTTPPTTVAPAACTNPAFTSSDPFAQWSTNGYLVNNNVWNTGEAGSQTLGACAWNKWYVISNQPGQGHDDSVKSYPDTQKNVSIPVAKMLDSCTTACVPSIPSTFNVKTPSAGGVVPANGPQWNAAYDMWLDGLGNFEVMIWNNWTSNWQFYYNSSGGRKVTVDGVVYSAWQRGTGIWFVRDTVTNVGSVDIAHILKASVAQGWLSNTRTLSAIEYGFEVNYTNTDARFDLLDYSLTTPSGAAVTLTESQQKINNLKERDARQALKAKQGR